MKRKASILAGVFAAAAVGVAAPASAAVITGTGSDFSDAWSFLGQPGNVSLTGNYSVDVTAFSSTSMTLLITLTNTSPGSNVRLVSWGFGTNPDITGVTFSDPQGSDGGMVNSLLDSIPNTGNQIEVCAFGGPNCNGGGSGGIQSQGGSDIFQLVLTGNWGSSLTLDPFGYKFQGPGGSYECLSNGNTSTCTGSPPPPPPPPPGQLLPEPGTLALIGLGALGVGALRRRKKLFDPNLGDK